MQTSTSLLSGNDWELIQKVNRSFPEKRIAESFNLFLSLPPDQRRSLAKEKQKTILRAGWIKCGIPVEKAETLKEHIDAMKEMAETQLKTDEKLADILAIIDVHEDGEAIIGDFTPGDPIDPDEKHRLERLAVNVIHEGCPDK